jgi:hypothetical protein
MRKDRMPKSYTGAYWDARYAGVDSCADSLAQFLDRLAAIDPLLTGWRNKGRTKREALDQPVVTTEHADLVARLSAGVNRRDVNHEPIEELGYSIGWWNGHGSKSAVTLSVALGVTSLWVGNCVVIHLPDPRAAKELYTATKALDVLHALIDVFAPDSAVWTNESLVAPQKEPDEPLETGGYALGGLVGVAAGWANYLRHGTSPTFDAAQLPISAVIEQVGDGSLVHVGDNPANPPLADVLQIRRAMGYPVREAEPSTTRLGEPASASASSGLTTAGPTERRAGPTSQQDANSSREKPDLDAN